MSTKAYFAGGLNHEQTVRLLYGITQWIAILDEASCRGSISMNGVSSFPWKYRPIIATYQLEWGKLFGDEQERGSSQRLLARAIVQQTASRLLYIFDSLYPEKVSVTQQTIQML